MDDVEVLQVNIIKEQWKEIVTSKKLLIPLIGVLFIPLIYSGVFLTAYWDPYGSVDKLPVAVVNNDNGADYEGTDLHIGDKMVKQLKDNDSFTWKFTDKKKAMQGLNDETYYMVVEIPENFSDEATTVMEKDPQQLDLKYHTNAGSNYAAAQIGDNAIKQLKASVAEEVTKQYVNVMFDTFDKIAKGMEEASSGAKEIDSGTKEAKSGSEQLSENLQKLAGSSATLNQGIQELDRGAHELNNGQQTLSGGLGQLSSKSSVLYTGADQAENGSAALESGLKKSLDGHQELAAKLPQQTAGLKELNNNAQRLAQFADSIDPEQIKELMRWVSNAEELQNQLNQIRTLEQAQNERVNQAVDSVEGITPEQKAEIKEKVNQAEGQDSLQSLQSVDLQIDELKKQLEGLPSPEELEKIKQLPENINKLYQGQLAIEDGVNKLTAATEQLYSGAGQLNDGQKQLLSGMETFISKLNEANKGASQLLTGSGKLAAGLDQAAGGTYGLQHGSSQLAEGSKSLESGLGNLASGTETLSNELEKTADKTGDIQAGDKNSQMIADPVQLDSDKMNAVENYGTGLTPYILSLALFVGALMITVIFPIKEPAAEPHSSFSWFMSKFSVILLGGILQAVIAVTVLIAGIGLEPESIWRFYLFSIITSLAFMSITQLLATTMGNPGRFISVILLVLQLGASAGTYPIELVPRFFQIIHFFLPMSYSIEGFRAAISTGDFSTMWQQASILGSFAIVMMLLTWGYFAWSLRRNNTEEHMA